jgi:uncharacterized phage-associated protein
MNCKKGESILSVFDVAKFILKTLGPMTAMKLEKLVYYCQAWSLVWDEQPLFKEKIRAWANGPVVYELFKQTQGLYMVSSIGVGDPKKISATQKATILAVLKYYGKKQSQWLSDLAHLEQPWRNARKGLSDNERGYNEITHAAMMEYYGNLQK